ncbi:MAG: phosphatase PAP2 family protein [Desulfobulbaceae bacterium]|nr:phosphatase PAP2 family protein [Desulfobulbaceae bacterium]
MQVRHATWLTFGLLVATIALFEMSDLDLALQLHLFDRQTGKWLIDAEEPGLRLIFYTGSKWLLITTGAALIFAWLTSFSSKRLAPYRKTLLFLILCLAAVPVAVSASKNTTNIFCPSDLTIFGGNKPYIKLFEPRDATIEDKGCCFPAGHASGGFSLLALYFLFRRSKDKLLGLGAGLTAGWLMGGYQMAKGAHFLSHTLVTMELAWLLILIIYGVLYRGWHTELAEADCRQYQSPPTSP